MSATGCYRCWTQGNRFTPAVWTDPEKDKLCESCRIALGWDESDCTAIGAPAPARQKAVGSPWHGNAALRKPPTFPTKSGESGTVSEVREKSASSSPRKPAAFDSRSPLQSLQGEPAATMHAEEKKTMGAKLTDRMCGHAGCTKFLSTANKSGYCTKHFYDSKRAAKANGGGRSKVNNLKAKPRKDGAPKSGKDRAAQVAANRVYQGPESPEVNGSGTATICVSEGALDRWWATASLEEKASAFSNHLSAAEEGL